MDDAKRKIFLAVGMLLTLAGCSLTIPTGAPPIREEAVLIHEPAYDSVRAVADAEPLYDPFLEAISATAAVTAWQKIPDSTVNETNSRPKISPINAVPAEPTPELLETPSETPATEIDSEIESEPKTEPVSEAEPDTEPITDAEQEAILAKDKWTKNIVLERWQENGMKDPFPNRNPNDQKRQMEINRLNMSEKEARKSKNFNYEYSTGLPSTWRWFHPEMEKLASIPSELRGNPEIFLRDENYQGKNNAVLRANAAILMGRDGDPLAEKELIGIVKNKDFRTELRCAAAETLGKLRTVSPDTLLPLLEPFKEKENEITNPQTGLTMKKLDAGNPILWLEILTALAERIEPWEHPCFLEPLSAQNYDVRFEAAKLWRRRSPPKKWDGTPADGTKYQLPNAFLEYARREMNPNIRIEIIRTLGLWKTPDIFKLLGSDLNREAVVRNAAIEALADAGSLEAVPLIKQRLTDPVPSNRVKAVEALRKLGSLDDVFRMVDDSDPSVRAEVAKAFADRRTSQTVALAKRCINDQHEKVRQATLNAVSDWSIEENGLILLDAAKSQGGPKIRTQAVSIFSRYGIENNDFDPAEQPKNQVKQYDELVRRFHAVIGSADFRSETAGNETQANMVIDPNDPVVADIRYCLSDWRKPNRSQEERQAIQNRLVDLEERLTPALDYLYEIERRKIPESLDPVIAEVDPVFEMIVRLGSEDVNEKRQAASELAQLAMIRNPGKLAIRRISDQACRQTDPRVLTSLLETLKKTDTESAKRFSVTLTESEPPELRRLACETFKELGDGNDLPLLVHLLHDSNRSVFQSSLEALSVIFRNINIQDYEAERAEIVELLETKLRQNDIRQQVQIAVVLHHLNEPIGMETLRRLALSPDSRIKCYVAEKIAELGDRHFVPVLISFLDDRNGSVRTAALNGLPKLTGEDIGLLDFGKTYSAETSITQQKITRWKKWAAHSSYRNAQ